MVVHFDLELTPARFEPVAIRQGHRPGDLRNEPTAPALRVEKGDAAKMAKHIDRVPEGQLLVTAGEADVLW